MPSSSVNLLQGTLDLLILKALALDAMHGLGISRRIEQITAGTFDVKPGSLFPALHRMERKGWLASEWETAKDHPRLLFAPGSRRRAGGKWTASGGMNRAMW